MDTQLRNHKWRHNVETALVALALRSRVQPSAIGRPGALAEVSAALSRKSYVAPVNGSDSTGTGSTSKPFKTLTAAVDRMGKPTSRSDFDAPWVIETLQPGRLADPDPFVKIPTRRVTLKMPGVVLPQAIALDVNDADKFGSQSFAELALVGGHPGRFAGGLGDMPTDGFRIGNTARNALFVSAESEGVLIRMDGVLLTGHFLHSFSNATSAGVALEAVRSVFSGVNTGAGLGALLGGPSASKCFAWLRECVIGPKYALELQALLEAAGCYVGAAVTVRDTPGDVFIGITDSMWLHGSAWTGPPNSMLVDKVTDHWLTANSISISNGAKLVLG